jgi:CO/xanthine dehydrogenase Mo-binding subunit
MAENSQHSISPQDGLRMIVGHSLVYRILPFGARSAGEAPIAAPTPAIAQAVYNAIGVWVDVPMTPERVLRALKRI